MSPQDLPSLESATSGGSNRVASEEEPDAELDASESRLLLAGAFKSLDDTDRRILYLRFVRELSRREVADELGVSQSALARRTNAALAKLRAELEGRPAAAEPEPEPEPGSPAAKGPARP